MIETMKEIVKDHLNSSCSLLIMSENGFTGNKTRRQFESGQTITKTQNEGLDFVQKFDICEATVKMILWISYREIVFLLIWLKDLWTGSKAIVLNLRQTNNFLRIYRDRTNY